MLEATLALSNRNKARTGRIERTGKANNN